MSNKKKCQECKMLKTIISETFWMARRYAHGRHTYVPSMVRSCYKTIKEKFPDILITKDVVIDETKYEKEKLGLPFDYLNDCNE